jgi:hypothetical protein
MKRKHEAQLKKIYDRHAGLYNDTNILFHKKSMSEADKKQLNELLGQHLRFQVELGKMLGMDEGARK